ncbi:T9SS type A sorting domain-containing protein [bacterium]|nr:MAG: T9SS type A sorting domain-containing protein [bacterium]
MKYFTLFFLLFIYSFGFGQTDEQKRAIVSKTNVLGLNHLSKELQNSEGARQERINSFLDNNTSVKRKYTSVTGGLYEINDIIDGKPVYITNDNQNAALATRTSKLHNGGSLGLNLEGQNMRIGIWDGGKVMLNHVEFMNDATPPTTRATNTDFPVPATDSHATHVAGTMVGKGVNPLAKGMAPKANIVSYNWNNDANEVVSEISNNGLLLSNHSYGVPVVTDNGTLNVPGWMPGCYNSDAREWDLIAVNAPYYLMIASAGNNGFGTSSFTQGLANGYDKLTGEKNSKNNLVIANGNPLVNPTSGDVFVSINMGSSQGPSDDGRVKPDITADGTDLFSAYNTNTTSYATLSGTSMAAPNTSGTLLLLQQYYSQLTSGTFMRSSTLKGLVCHTALDSGVTGPDAKFGWGFLDAEKSAVLMQNSFAETPTAILTEIVLNQGETYSVQVNATTVQKLQATICWLDPAGTSRNNQLNSTVPVLVNDLDLRIKKGTQISLPWKLQLSGLGNPTPKGDNIVDNVERVDVDNASGLYTIEITHKGNLQGGSQAVSLIVSGFNTTTLSNPDFQLNKLSIFPNPTNNILNFNLGDSASINNISIIDVTGKVIIPKFDLNSKTIDVSNLQSGVYFVRFDSEGQSLTKKFIKM